MVKKKYISSSTIMHDIDKNIRLNKKAWKISLYGSSKTFKERTNVALNDHYYVSCKVSRSIFLLPISILKLIWFWIVNSFYFIIRCFYKLFKKINEIRSILR